MLITLNQAVDLSQAHMSQQFPKLSKDNSNISKEQYLSSLKKFVSDMNMTVADMTEQELIERIYSECKEYGVLTKYLYDPEVEEINVNAWYDIKVRYAGKQPISIKETFLDERKAKAIIDKMFDGTSGVQLDASRPIVRSYMNINGTKVRITAVFGDIVDAEDSIIVSIRKINPKKLDKEDFIRFGTVSEELLNFTESLVKCRVSAAIGGSTGSGKTTWLEYMLTLVDNKDQITTIEEDVREFNLRKFKNEVVENNIQHMRTKKSDDPSKAVNQTKLLETSLTLDPTYIVIGEMKGAEAWAAQEAGHTGHTVYTSIHINRATDCPTRMLTLIRQEKQLDDALVYRLVTEAFPIVYYFAQLPDGTRKCMEVVEFYNEGNILDTDIRVRTLFKYTVTGYDRDDTGKIIKVNGYHKRIEDISPKLVDDIKMNGIDEELIQGLLLRPNRVGDLVD